MDRGLDGRFIRVDRPTVAVDVFLSGMKLFLLFFAVWSFVGALALQISGEGPSAGAWRDVLVGGVALGSMYGLIALGYSMVYGILGFINFAHGEVFMCGLLTGFFVASALNDVGIWTDAFAVALLIVLVSSMLASMAVAVLIERIAYRRLRAAPRLIPLITSIGVSFFVQYAVRGLFGAGVKHYPAAPLGSDRLNILGIEIAPVQALVFVVAGVAVAGLSWFVRKSKTGRAIRAIAEDKEIAALMGINVDRAIILTFAVGGAMAGVAGTMWALLFRGFNFTAGFLPGIKAFTAAVLGGIGNLPGAMLGGLTLGMVESAGPTMLRSLRWSIPSTLAYALGFAAIAGVVWGVVKLREGHIRNVTSAMSLIVVGAGFAVLSFTVFPGFQVVIPATAQLKDMIAFIVLIGVLMIRPVGLLGERLAVEERG